MKTLTFVTIPLIMMLGACATQMKELPLADTPSVKFAKSESDPKIIVLDPDCAALAKYARYVAFLRDSGVHLVDVPVLVTESPTGLAVSVINREVYARADISPEVGQKNSYEVCRTNSYSTMVSALASAEKKFNDDEAAKIKIELADKKSKHPKKK